MRLSRSTAGYSPTQSHVDIGMGEGILATRHWRTVLDSIGGRPGPAAVPKVDQKRRPALEGTTEELDPVIFPMDWVHRQREAEVLALGFEEGDDESRAFFDKE